MDTGNEIQRQTTSSQSMEAGPRKLPVRIGGLFRCCLETLDTTPVIEEEGTILQCKYCKGSLRIREGAWEWNDVPENDLDGVETQVVYPPIWVASQSAALAIGNP